MESKSVTLYRLFTQVLYSTCNLEHVFETLMCYRCAREYLNDNSGSDHKHNQSRFVAVGPRNRKRQHSASFSRCTEPREQTPRVTHTDSSPLEPNATRTHVGTFALCELFCAFVSHLNPPRSCGTQTTQCVVLTRRGCLFMEQKQSKQKFYVRISGQCHAGSTAWLRWNYFHRYTR